MKKTIITALLSIVMMLIVTPVQAKDKIIERPALSRWAQLLSATLQ